MLKNKKILLTLIAVLFILPVFAKNYTEQDIKRLKTFAAKGNSAALTELGVIYQNGCKYLPRNIDKAVECYKKSADLGGVAALVNLSQLYLKNIYRENGITIEAGYQKAIQYLKKAVNKGSTDAYVNLGYAYDDGLGVPKNPVLAEKYYKLAAEAGIPLGQFDLAYFYMHQKNKKSYYWFKKAAENKYANAYTYLAIYYISATVVKKDLAKAYMYAKYGEILGAQGADNALNKAILPEINPAEKAQGEKLLKEYIAKHPINND